MKGEDDEETEALRRMAEDAEAYLMSHKWCKGIAERSFGIGIGGVVAVFHYQIEPAHGADAEIWVVTGDVPRLYMSGVVATTPIEALEYYIAALRPWVDYAMTGAGSPGIDFPMLPVPADKEHGEMLKKRLDSIESDIIPYFKSE